VVDASLFSSGKDDWGTPQWLVELVVELYRGTINTDPCSNPGSLVPAERKIMLPEDGLAALPSWGERVRFRCLFEGAGAVR
jgi:hypothetical protein